MRIPILRPKQISNLFLMHRVKLMLNQEKGRYSLMDVDLMCIGVITGIVLISYGLATKALFIPSGCLLILLGIGLFILYFKKTKNFLNSRGLYFLFWLFAVGLSALKIHPMQVMWKWQTWFCIWASLVMFLIGYNVAAITKVRRIRIKCFHVDSLTVIYGLSALIFVVFMLETIVAGGVPLFSSNMEAYQTFALPYLHYITVSSVLIMPLTILYLWNHRCNKTTLLILLITNCVMLMIPVLIVSRQLLITNAIFVFFTFLEMENKSKVPKKYLVIFSVVLCVAWLILSLSRNQSDAYIKYVLRLDDKMSVPMYQIYMYIAFNIDNFNDTVGRVDRCSYILSSLNPLLTFTGTKGLIESVAHVTLPDRMLSVYNTYGFLLTPYVDMREPGVAIYCTVMGFFTGVVEKDVLRKKSIKNLMFHVIVNYVLMFSFFSAFLSNTSIWAYLIIILIADMLTS